MIRLEEKENDLKREYAKLHERYTELFKTHCDYMERTKILFGNENRLDAGNQNSCGHSGASTSSRFKQNQTRHTASSSGGGGGGHSSQLSELLRASNVSVNRNELINAIKTSSRTEINSVINGLLAQELSQPDSAANGNLAAQQTSPSAAVSAAGEGSCNSLNSLTAQANLQANNMLEHELIDNDERTISNSSLNDQSQSSTGLFSLFLAYLAVSLK